MNEWLEGVRRQRGQGWLNAPAHFAPAPPHKTKEANMKKQEIDECCTMLTACIVRQLKALSLEELREAYAAVCKITDKKKPDFQ